MTTHARARLGHALFGSVAEDLLRDTNEAALLIGPSVPDEAMSPSELIVCLDGSDVAHAILPFAAAWAATSISMFCCSECPKQTQNPDAMPS